MTRILVSLLLGATIASAADQAILGNQLVVKNPSTPEKPSLVTDKVRQQELEAFLKGPSDPYFAAYELQTLTQKDPKEMEVKLAMISVSKGKRGSKSQDARLVVREGKTDWNIDEFELVK